MTIEHPFAQYVRILGKGKRGSRDLTREEAFAAMTMMLSGQVEPEQLGAFLMLLRHKEECAPELAGFVDAVRQHNGFAHKPMARTQVDLDWSTYAGKKRHQAWFLLAALLVAQQGYKVFMHGAKGHTAGRVYSEDLLLDLGIVPAQDWHQAEQQLSANNFSFMSLKHLSPELDRMINLRNILGLRSPVHTLTRLLNPTQAQHTIDGVFHPAYGPLHQQAALLLQQPRSLTIRGDGGEAEIRPDTDCELQWADEQQHASQPWLRLLDKRAEAPAQLSAAQLKEVWLGDKIDTYGEAAVVSTTAAIVLLLKLTSDRQQALTIAGDWWQQRHPFL
ncbi:MAG TPA: glycosyl transferase family protein [Oceanospirillaceae bacterium]|nr:glycosyl transferase family protein [Oceanospirillaceae bacterium]